MKILYVRKDTGEVVDINGYVHKTNEGWIVAVFVTGKDPEASLSPPFPDRADAILLACETFGLKAKPPCDNHPDQPAGWACSDGDFNRPVCAWLCATCGDDHHRECDHLAEGANSLKPIP